MSGLSNEDFRKIMMTPRPGAVPAAASAVPKNSGEKSDAKEKKKKKWFKQKKNEGEEDDKPKYRDRAAERRSGVDVEYVDASTGIKGLSDDEAAPTSDAVVDPEAQTKAQLSAAIKRAKAVHTPSGDGEVNDADSTSSKKAILKPPVVEFHSDLGRAVYEQLNAKKNLNGGILKSTYNAPLQSELILPSRKLLRFHTDPNSMFELPEIIVRSKHEVQEDNTKMLKLNDTVMENIAKVMSYISVKKKESKKSEKLAEKLKEQYLNSDTLLRVSPLQLPSKQKAPITSPSSSSSTPRKGVSFAVPPSLGGKEDGKKTSIEDEEEKPAVAPTGPAAPAKPVMTEAPDEDDIFSGVGAFVPTAPIPRSAAAAAAAVSSATSFKAPQPVSAAKKTGTSYFGASADKSFTLEDLKKAGPQIKLKAEALKQLKEEEAAANQAEDALESAVLSSQVKPIRGVEAAEPLSKEERQRRIDAEFEATVSGRPSTAEADMEVEAPPADDDNAYPNTDNAYPNTANAYPNTDDAYPNTDNAYPNTDNAYPDTESQYAAIAAPPKKKPAPTFAVVVETPLTDLEKKARGFSSVFRRDDSKARIAPTTKVKPEEKQATHVPDSYAECYPSAFETTFEVYEESDEEADLSKMDPGAAGVKKRLKRWDFETEEQWADYNQKKEALPKAAFQFGVKMSDGRKTRRQKVSEGKEGNREGNNSKKKESKLNQELKKISGLMDDMKQNPNKRPKKGGDDD